MEGSKWLISHPYHFTPSKRVSGTHPIGGWENHRTGPNIFEKRTISWSCLELDQDHTACSMITTLTTSKWEKPSTVALNMLLGFSYYSSLQFTSSHHTSIRLILILSSSLPLCIIASLSFLQFSPPKPSKDFYFLSVYMSFAPPISSSCILMPKGYSFQSTNHEASHYAIFSILHSSIHVEAHYTNSKQGIHNT